MSSLGQPLLNWADGDTISLRLTYQDTVAPAFVSSAATGNSLVLTFDGALDVASTPPASAFAVTIAGNVRAVTNVTLSVSTVTLTFAGAAITSDQVLTVTYTAPGSGKLQDEYGNATAHFSDPPVPPSGDATLGSLTITIPVSPDPDPPDPDPTDPDPTDPDPADPDPIDPDPTLVNTDTGQPQEFDPDISRYTASVENHITSVVVTAITNDDGARTPVIRLDGRTEGVASDGTISLSLGHELHHD